MVRAGHFADLGHGDLGGGGGVVVVVRALAGWRDFDRNAHAFQQPPKSGVNWLTLAMVTWGGGGVVSVCGPCQRELGFLLLIKKSVCVVF